MARVTTLVYWAKGKKPRTSDSTTPGSIVRPPLLSNAQSFYAPTVNADGLILAPFVDNSSAFYGPIVSAAAVFISPPLLANTQVFFPPTVNQSIQLPLHTNEQSFGEALILQGQSVVSPLLDAGQTFYGPQLNLSATAPLLTNTEALYGPTIVTGTSIIPTPLVNAQTFYGPQLNLKVSPALLTNTQAFPSPSVASGYIINPTTFGNGQAFYAPQVNLKVIAGFISNAQTFYGPVLSTDTLVVAPLLSNSQTFYGPKLNLKVTAPLLTNTSTFHAPAVIPDTAQAVNAPYHLNEQTFYGPKINRNIKPAKLTNTNGFFPPTVSNGAIPGYALTTPVLTVTSAVGEVPEITASLASDISAGMYLRIQRSTTGTKNLSDGTYVSPTLNVKHFISGTEWAEAAITNADLAPDGYVDPFGAWFQLYWIETEDGTLSGKAEVSGTITGSAASWSGQTGVNKSQYLDVTGLSAEVNANVNSRCGVRATIPSQNDEFYFEVEIDELNTSIMAGIVDGTSSLVTTTAVPGSTSVAPGGAVLKVNIGTTAASIARSHGTANVTLAAIPQVGDRLCVAGKKSAARLRFYHYRTATGTRTQVGTDALLVNGNPPDWYAYGAGFRKTTLKDAFTGVFASADFALSAPAGENIYG